MNRISFLFRLVVFYLLPHPRPPSVDAFAMMQTNEMASTANDKRTRLKCAVVIEGSVCSINRT